MIKFTIEGFSFFKSVLAQFVTSGQHASNSMCSILYCTSLVIHLYERLKDASDLANIFCNTENGFVGEKIENNY